jgi:NDP-4-keto-2,6-dideoxyhexose 3-C-methyltransferase
MRKCRVCNSDCKELFSLGNLCLSDFIPQNKVSVGFKSSLDLVMCEFCKLVQLKESAPTSMMYGRYWYRSGINNTMKDALKDVVKSCLGSIETVDNDVFLDIASNDGTLLSYVPKNLIRIGIDPADDSYKNEALKHANDIVQDYFSAEAYRQSKYGHLKAKIVTVIAMFYDLDNPVQFLKDVNAVMHDDGLLVMQLSYTPLMLKQLAFDNICHEHICYYTLKSLDYVLAKAGFIILDAELNDVNGGSIRVFIRKMKSDRNNFLTAPQRDIADFRVLSYLENEWFANDSKFYEYFYRNIVVLRDKTVGFIIDAKAKGKHIWAYGASTKGNTLLQWYGLGHTLINGIAERSPYKFGLLTVGTHIPIYSEQEMRQARPDYLLILPWHFVTEFKKREKDYLLSGGHFIVPCPKFEVI